MMMMMMVDKFVGNKQTIIIDLTIVNPYYIEIEREIFFLLESFVLDSRLNYKQKKPTIFNPEKDFFFFVIK